MVSTHYMTAVFYKKARLENLPEIKILANPWSLIDVIYWLVGIEECLECCNILLPSYMKPLMWWCGPMNGLNSLQYSHFLQEAAANKNLCEIKFQANPRLLIDVMYWLVCIQECLECCNILLPSYMKPLMWWWTYEWPQLITIQPFFTKGCEQESVWDQISG